MNLQELTYRYTGGDLGLSEAFQRELVTVYKTRGSDKCSLLSNRTFRPEGHQGCGSSHNNSASTPCQLCVTTVVQDPLFHRDRLFHCCDVAVS